MSTILQKHQMGEEDIKLQYITPAILSKWSREKITMETRITDGKINLKGNFVFREKPKRADYILYLSANNPIAIVEAKDNTHAVSHGLQQAMTYAQMLDIPFAYSSNGDGFMEHDFLTGPGARDRPGRISIRAGVGYPLQARIWLNAPTGNHPGTALLFQPEYLSSALLPAYRH